MRGIDARIRQLETRAHAATAPVDLNACVWDLAALTVDEVRTLRALAATAARPTAKAKWEQQFDHERFAAMYRATLSGGAA
jgi:hypothetical protein